MSPNHDCYSTKIHGRPFYLFSKPYDRSSFDLSHELFNEVDNEEFLFQILQIAVAKFGFQNGRMHIDNESFYISDRVIGYNEINELNFWWSFDSIFSLLKPRVCCALSIEYRLKIKDYILIEDHDNDSCISDYVVYESRDTFLLNVDEYITF